MDMDTTIKGFSLTEENINNIMNEICNIDLKDDITLEIKNITLIREEDDYSGYRVTFEAIYNNEMPVIMKIDITTGDKITYKEVKYDFSLMLEDRKTQVWSYNIETIIAEKFESIIKRAILGTRIRDYYDIHMLLNTQSKNVDEDTLKQAIISTAKHRETLEIIKDWKEVVEILKEDESMKNQWERYKKNNFYAEGIEYKDLIESLIKVGQAFSV